MIHVVAGPTASGKTAYAHKLAQQLNGVLINVDARQIYKYLDIGTNKDPDIVVDLVSFLEPDQTFSAFAHRQLVHKAIDKVQAEGKVAILVGGTGLYIDVILHPERYSNSTQAADELRAQLSGLTLDELQERALEIDAEAGLLLNASDWKNPRRLIRLIEKASTSPVQSQLPSPSYEYVVHYPQISRPDLFARIDARAVEMWQHGLVLEVERVLEMGYPKDAIALQGIGYRQVLDFLEGKIDEPICIAQIQAAHRQYAKRQETWFSKYLLPGSKVMGYNPMA